MWKSYMDDDTKSAINVRVDFALRNYPGAGLRCFRL